MLVAKRLTKVYGERTLWSDISLTVESGEMLAVVGASGCGKTTLLNCFGALERPSKGEIFWKGSDIAGAGESQRRRTRRTELGYLFQNYALVENATIEKNINYAVAGPWPWIRRNYSSELSRVGLEGRQNEYVFRLSGGEQQRVALARVIAKRPGLILADEPTGALDEGNAKVVVDILRSLANDGAAVIVATHNDAVKDACDSSLDLSCVE